MSEPRQRLRDRIAEHGPIPFAEFMEEALYGAGGYYARGRAPTGTGGDFVTGSTLSPLFGQGTARLVRGLDALLPRPADYLEIGYGSGAHLQALVESLGRSEPRRILAHDRVPGTLPAGVETVGNLERLEPRSLCGLVFSYELFDALPVHRLIGRAGGGVGELWVDLAAAGEFCYLEGRLSDPALRGLLGEAAGSLSTGQIADLAPGWAPLYRQLAVLLDRGLIVTCDYGFERQRLLDPRVRHHGTLACYRQHHVHRNALAAAGEQDLTAHVDFTRLREEGETVGLETVAFTRQGRWLMACGIFDQLQQAPQTTRLAAMDLLDPSGMGEEIRVLIQSRGIDPRAVLDLDLLAG